MQEKISVIKLEKNFLGEKIMNEQKYPQFERLHILRTEALCSIRDRAFDIFPLFMQKFGDGIVSGCRPITTQDTITLSTGMILHNNFFYLLKEPMSVEYSPTEEYMMMKIIFEPELETENFTQRNVNLILTHDMNIASDEMEICRFKLKKGAVLRTEYTDFFDRVTEFDTVNTVNVPYAAVGGQTLSPEILFAFANEARDFELNDADYNFCLNALGGRLTSPAQIIFYIEHRLKTELNKPTNQILYENLCKILREIKNGRRREIVGTRRRRREIMLE